MIRSLSLSANCRSIDTVYANYYLFFSKKRPSENGNAEKGEVVNGGGTSTPSVNGKDSMSNGLPEETASDVRFIGEGVLVGKSALKSGEGKKFKISFDDNATFYEYPSEQV